MSLPAPYIEAYHVADGITTSFPFGTAFTAPSAANVKCIIYFEDGTNCVPTFTVDITTGYITIVTLTKPDGTVLTVPPAGSIVRVFRDTPEQQNVTASQLQNYTAKQLERIFDSVVAMIQETSFLARRKTIRLTETQRDVSVEQLTESKDQSVIYWDFETRQLKATEYGQDEIVKSETVDRLVYLQPEGKIYFIPKGTTTQIPVGSATIHNDLSGRNAPDCHPESAITNLTTHLQELRDKDTNIEAKADEALRKANEVVDTADEALETANEAMELASSFDERITKNEEDIAEILDGGSIDGVTITVNDDSKWEVQAVKNRNTEAGATQPIYDWVGTLAEYTDQNIATLHPEWLCFITDDTFNTRSTYVFDQGVATTTWNITHNLDKYPSVTVVDSAGTTIDCTVIYINSNECELRFNAAFKGSAYLN